MKFSLWLVVAVLEIFSAAAAPLIATNSTWAYFKGTAEASAPASAWRSSGFDDSLWLTGPAPFYYENDPGSGTAFTGNTQLTDMFGGYSCIFMREKFTVPNPALIAQLQLSALSDDGFIAWINGVEVVRFNMPAGDIPYSGTSSGSLAEPLSVQNFVLSNPQSFLVPGTNVLAIQAFNSSKSSSSDFVIWANLGTSTTAPWNGVGISEFMATNLTTVLDVDGTPSPWIEIYNPTASDENLSGWSLTTDTNNLRQWVFPNVTLPCRENANGSDNFMVVFASGKNRAVNTNELHTNFRLPVNGGYLALVNAAGTVASVFNYPTQRLDMAYGRDMVNPGITGFFPKATPGEANVNTSTNFVPAVVFSRAGGTFVSTFNLQLSVADTNATIYYTLDGSAPTQDSPVYTGPLAITGSVQVRARAFDDLNGFMPSALHSESYIQVDASLLSTASTLPAIILYNFNAGGVPEDTDQFVNISVYEPTNSLTRLTNASTLTSRGTIHVRGSSSVYFDKKAYSLDFTDELGDGKNYPPLGLPSESSFVLYAPNAFEPVLIHNPLIYQLSNEIGRYAPRTRFCEVYLNTSGGKVTAANYNGIYVLEEKIKWDDDRVAIAKIHSVDNLGPLDNSQTNVTGGYMMKIDRLGPGESGFNSAGQNIVYNYPKEQEMNTPQRAPQKQYLQSYMDAFGTALNGVNYKDPTNGFRAYIDQASWIDHHILNVTAFNVDALRLSGYFYKDRTNKLVFGPIWDFDRTQGSTDGRDFSPLFWRSPTGDLGTDFFNYTWWGRMFTDIDFWQTWIDRYQDLRENVLSTNHIYAVIDTMVAQVQPQQPREVARWPQYTTPRSGAVSVSGYTYVFPGTYQGEVAFLKKWYADRLRFMDTNFLAKPLFSNNTGAITNGATLALIAPGATIYYTTNGLDPRASGGGVALGSLVYSSPIPLTTNVTIRARALNGARQNLTGANNPPLTSPWSGLASQSFVMAAAPVVTQGPVSLEAYVGQSPTFAVAAFGYPAPTYQWQFNDANLVGQTNAQLTLTNVQAGQAGAYTVIVTNLAGGTNVSALLTISPKPNLVITEVMSSEAKKAAGVTISTSDWWELSNFGNSPVNLQGYRFDDDHNSFATAQTLAGAVTIAPGESIVLVQDMTPADFRTWWGAQKLPPALQIITYPSIGFGSDTDAIHLWNAAANTITDTVANVTFGVATKGVSFGYDRSSQIFGGLSVVGQNGAFVATLNGDIGSPGKLITPPLVGNVTFSEETGFSLGFTTQTNLNYRVEYKDDLTAPDWSALTNFTATSSSFTFADPDAGTNSARFYRVVVTP